MNNEYGLSDQVIARIAQIIQEAMMTGVDCVDLLRQVRVTGELTEFDSATGALVLTEAYKQQVKNMHDKLLADAERLAAQGQLTGEQESTFKLFKE